MGASAAGGQLELRIDRGISLMQGLVIAFSGRPQGLASTRIQINPGLRPAWQKHRSNLCRIQRNSLQKLVFVTDAVLALGLIGISRPADLSETVFRKG